MSLFILTFARRFWFNKKRYVIPICCLILLAIVGLVIGVVEATKKKAVPGMMFDILFSWKASERSFQKS
jgi:hypothetical protein